jgi:transposase-like protein
MSHTHDGRTGGVAAVLPRAITQAQLIRDWRETLDAFGEALEHEDRYYTRPELKELERRLAADRRWLEGMTA